MAIEKLKLVNISANINDLDKLCETFLDFNDLHLVKLTVPKRQAKMFRVYTEENPYKDTLKQIETFASLSSIKLNDESVQNERVGDLNKKISRLSDKYNKLRENKANLETAISDCENLLLQLSHMKNTDVDLDMIFSLKYIKFRFGRMAREDYEQLKNYTSTNMFVYVESSVEPDCVWGMYFCAASEASGVDDIFYRLGFERVFISEQAHGTPDAAYKTTEEKIVDYKKHLEELEQDIAAFNKDNAQYILSSWNITHKAFMAFDVRYFCIVSDEACIFNAWVPKSKCALLENELSKIESAKLAYSDEKKAHATPTKLKSSYITKPFESFVLMSGVPNYKELNPTAFMTLFFTVLFGIMAGDVGQGIVLFLAGIIFYLVKKSEFGKLLSMLGISATTFGFIYGEIFGYEDVLPALFRPTEHINATLGYSIALGVFCISVSIVLNIINGFKQKNYEKMIFGNNGLVGLIFYWMLAFAVSDMLMFGSAVNVFKWWWYTSALVVLALIILFREPISRLVSRTKSEKKESFGEFLLANIFEMFEVVLSYITNTISFLRVGAFAIIHASMMAAVFTLAGGHSDPNIIVVILGNAFVMCFEGLISGIQALRLNLYEMFSRFFEGNGIKYEDVKTKINNLHK